MAPAGEVAELDAVFQVLFVATLEPKSELMYSPLLSYQWIVMEVSPSLGGDFTFADAV